jgi:hypothetical protein
MKQFPVFAPLAAASGGSAPSPRNRYEYSVLVLPLEKKGLAMTRKDVLQGLSAESATQLRDLGNDGWEMVGVLPFQVGGVGLFSAASTGTDAALAIFKRTVYLWGLT